MRSSGPLILGVGNRFRSDDGAGAFVVDLLRDGDFDVREESGEGASLIAAFEGRDVVVIIDAMKSGAPPGTVRRFDAVRETLPTGLFHYSSHQFGVAEAVETARALGRLPRSLILFGIEGKSYDYGNMLTAEVDHAVRVVAEEIKALIPADPQ